MTGLVARYVIGVLIGTLLVVARMSQLPCSVAATGSGIFGGICRRPFAKALRGSFVTGMNRNVLELVDVERRDSVAQIYLDRYVREKSVEIREQLCEDNLSQISFGSAEGLIHLVMKTCAHCTDVRCMSGAG